MATFDSYVQGSVVYSDERRTDLRDLENSIIGNMPSYTVADIAAGFGKDDWRLELFVTNVFDDQYVTGVNNITANTFGTPFASISEPRAWGVDFRVGF